MGEHVSKDSVDETPMPEILVYFDYDHLPPHLANVSQPFGELAQDLVEVLPDSEQRQLALTQLLLAKDAAVRAALPLGKSHV